LTQFALILTVEQQQLQCVLKGFTHLVPVLSASENARLNSMVKFLFDAEHAHDQYSNSTNDKLQVTTSCCCKHIIMQVREHLVR